MTTVPELCIVDTNVGIVANGESSHASPACEIACIEVIQTIVASRRLALDNGDLIFDEYRHNMRLAGQPGVGDQFMKWVNDHMWDETRCLRVPLTPQGLDPDDFEEFPDHLGLTNFNWADRKFVAVAAACPEHAVILNAVDNDWKHHEQEFLAVAIEVISLCPDDLRKQ